MADDLNHRIQIFTQTGQFIGQFGSNGIGEGQFISPRKIAINSSGAVYVIDWNIIKEDLKRVQIFDCNGKFLHQFNLTTTQNNFGIPGGIAINSSGFVFVSDQYNNKICVYDNNGNFIYEFGQKGTSKGKLNAPTSLAFNSTGMLYVANNFPGKENIQVFDSMGNYQQLFGNYFTYDIAIDSEGYAYLTSSNNEIFIYPPIDYTNFIVEFVPTAKILYWVVLIVGIIFLVTRSNDWCKETGSKSLTFLGIIDFSLACVIWLADISLISMGSFILRLILITTAMLMAKFYGAILSIKRDLPDKYDFLFNIIAWGSPYVMSYMNNELWWIFLFAYGGILAILFLPNKFPN